jgi:hypothetical protein
VTLDLAPSSRDLGAQGSELNFFRTTMQGVRPRLAVASEHVFSIDDLNDLEFRRIRLGIRNV